MADTITVCSIGHSNHTIEEFVTLLQRHDIRILADVRSQPYSRYSPHFNREVLAQSLKNVGIRYVFLGASLGGRPEDPALYDPGQERPNYGRQRETPRFQQGLHELIALATALPTTMMCSEGDPHSCHRQWSITPSLLALEVVVLHIHPDGHLEVAEPTMEQMGFGF